MKDSCEVAIIGSGFAASILARVLAVLGYDVVLLERGTHPRFAIGESSTPLANLSLERIGIRYGLADCYRLATHGRWMAHFPELERGLKRGFTFYRHHPDEQFANRGLDSERLLVAASPKDSLADTHWLRADVDHHLVRQAVTAGVDYRDHVELTCAIAAADGVELRGSREGTPFRLSAGFVIDASGPAGFLARQLSIASGVERTKTRSALVGSHFRDMKLMRDVVAGMPDGPYPDDWAAVHHVIDEGWMYSLRFDHGVTSAGFLLTPRGMSGLCTPGCVDADAIWCAVLARYPTLAAVFADATPVRPLSFHASVQHRLTRSAGERWALLPHAYAFVDPLFSTGMAWSLRAVERLALAFESAARGCRVPDADVLERYDSALGAEADQIDEMIAGAYEAMAHFDLLTAHAMLYFATVSFAEVRQRLVPDDTGQEAGPSLRSGRHPVALAPDDTGQEAGPSLRSGRHRGAWSGFLGVGDDVLGPLPSEALRRLRSITLGRGEAGTPAQRHEFVEWMGRAIAPRNIAGLANPARRNLYPVDFDALVEQHALLGMDRAQLLDALPRLRGMAPEPAFTWSG